MPGATKGAHASDAEYDATDNAVDGEEEIDEAGKEEKHGHVKQRWHGFDGLGQAERLHALEEVLTRASALVQRGLCLRELQVPACPLLHQGRGNGAYQAQGEADKPEDVDADG